MIVKDLLERFKDADPEMPICAVIWHVDDVKGQDENNVLTDEDAAEILAIMDRQHDACIGINWEVIDCHIDMYLEDKND